MKIPTTHDTIVLKYLSAEDVVTEINTAFKKYGKENVQFEVDTRWEYGNEVADCFLRCARPMNAEEFKRHKELTEEQEAARKAYARQQYEKLKKEFG